MASAYKFNKSCLAWTEATGNAWWLWGSSTHLEHPLDIHGFHFIGYVIWFSWQTLFLHLLSSVTIPQLHLKRQPRKKNLFPSPWPKVAGSISITISISISIGICIRKYQLLLALAFIRDSSSHRHTCTSLFPPKGRKKSISTLEIAFRGDSLPPPCYPPGSMFAFWPSKKAGQSWDQIVSVLQPIHRPVHSNHTYEGLWRSYKYQTLGDILPRLKVELIFFLGGGGHFWSWLQDFKVVHIHIKMPTPKHPSVP